MKFKVIETRPAVQVYTYEVEAASEDAAIQLIENGEVDPSDYSIEEESPFQCSEYKVEEIEEINY